MTDTIIATCSAPVGWFAAYTTGDGDLAYLPVAAWASTCSDELGADVEVEALVADGSTLLKLATAVELGAFLGYLCDPTRRPGNPFAEAPSSITVAAGAPVPGGAR